MEEKLIEHRKVWQEKRILREIYRGWYRKIIGDFSLISGKNIEIGSGSGNFKEFKRDIIACDIVDCEWIDMCFDAHNMPFKANSIINIVMIDVLHHLANPIKFFDEASRVLKKNGRLILIEPYPSPFSRLVYKLFHPEPFLMNVNYFIKTEIEDKEPWEANQAAAFLIFYKYRNRFESIFKNKLRLIKRHRMSCILYPASGGFENRSLIPEVFIPLFKLLEALLTPFRFLLAFRCYLVIEKV